MQVMKCDRCGRVQKFIRPDGMLTVTTSTGFAPTREYELCKSCANAFRTFMKTYDEQD